MALAMSAKFGGRQIHVAQSLLTVLLGYSPFRLPHTPYLLVGLFFLSLCSGRLSSESKIQGGRIPAIAANTPATPLTSRKTGVSPTLWVKLPRRRSFCFLETGQFAVSISTLKR
jgi:hypothetical protein